MDDSPIALPVLPQKPARPPFPWLAATVPLLGGVVLWAVTGSAYSLLFALLGPVIAVASRLDSARGSRREQRAAHARYDDDTARAERAIVARHDHERSGLDARYPDALQLASSPDDIWRAVPSRSDGIVVARGRRPSQCRVAAPAGAAEGVDAAARTQGLQALATTLENAPITTPISGGVTILGTSPLAIAAARALVLQLCLAHAPDTLHLEVLPEQGWEWAHELPHAAEAPMPARGTADARPVRVVVIDADRSPALTRSGLVLPDSDQPRVRIVYGSPGAPADPRSQAHLAVHGVDGSARLTAVGGLEDVRVQLVGEAQARAIAASLAERATALFPVAHEEAAPSSLAQLLSDARAQDSSPAHPVGGGLPAPIGSMGAAPMLLDIVADGPHALVVGMTGSGKSELLLSWISALAALYPPERVVFLLADFKGGTAFAPLASLPHVVGVISDLEAAGAARALQSLRAEIRWREAQLAAVGARDIADGIAQIPRLVVVVDEFAALIAQHPELHELFADIAARGRALGIHLILGTQRAAGSVRDALLANLSLRVCLRVVDEADSRAVIGVPGAAVLSASLPGVALVRRPIDDAPHAVRVARSTPFDRDAAAERWAGHPTPRRPWLPPLPRRLEPAALVDAVAAALEQDGARNAGVVGVENGLALGLLDEPAAQRQRPWMFSPAAERSLLVIGGPGSGKSGALQAVGDAVRLAGASGQEIECLWVPADPEGAWDTLEHLSLWEPPAGTVVIIDNLDAVIASLSTDYAAVFISRIETLLREGGRTGIAVVASVQRLPIAGSRIGELFNTRLVLSLAHRSDHLAAGADGASFAAERPVGRGIVGGLEVQVVLPRGAASATDPRGTGLPQRRLWRPEAGLVGVVCRTPVVLEERLRDAWAADGTVIVALRALQAGTRAAELAALGSSGAPGVFGALGALGDDAGSGVAGAASAAVVVVGDADAWQQHWSLLAAIRAGHPLIVDGGSLGEFRALTGSRELPPYLSGDASWLCAPDGSVSRVHLPKAVRPRPSSNAAGRLPAALRGAERA